MYHTWFGPTLQMHNACTWESRFASSRAAYKVTHAPHNQNPLVEHNSTHTHTLLRTVCQASSVLGQLRHAYVACNERLVANHTHAHTRTYSCTHTHSCTHTTPPSVHHKTRQITQTQHQCLLLLTRTLHHTVSRFSTVRAASMSHSHFFSLSGPSF